MKVDKFISHRGANTDFVENTIHAFQIARDYGFSWIEIDVQMSCDGELFLFHDKTAKRLALIDQNVTDMSLANLKKLKLIHPTFKTIGDIPTLKEYFDWATQAGAYTNIEFKITSNDENYQIELVQKTLDLLDQYPELGKKILFSSFSEVVMKNLKKYKKYSKGKLFYTTNWSKDFKYIDQKLYRHYKKNHYVAIIINYGCLNKKRALYLKQKFKKVFVYSVYTDYEVKQLLSWGVDAMFVDKKEQINIFL